MKKIIAIIIAQASLMTASCQTTKGNNNKINQAEEMQRYHGVKAVNVPPFYAITWISSIPGAKYEICQDGQIKTGDLHVTNCTDMDSQMLMDDLIRTQEEMKEKIPGWEPSKWTIEIIPQNMQRSLRSIKITRQPKIPLSLVFAASNDHSETRREITRTIAHETFHVIEKYRQNNTNMQVKNNADDNEYRAYLAGSCIEYYVHGSIKVQHIDAPKFPSHPNNQNLINSVSGMIRANEEILNIYQNENKDSKSTFEYLCSEILEYTPNTTPQSIPIN